MNKEISTKRFVMILKDGSKFFLEENEAEAVKEAVRKGLNYLEVGDSLISIYDFARIVGSDNYEEAEKIKKGEWKCKYGKWHQRFDKCGHGDLEQYPVFKS